MKPILFKILIILLWSFLMWQQANAFSGNNSCPDDAQALSPEPLQEEWAVEWWMPRHEQKLVEEGRESAELLFLGDSITHGWESDGEEVAEDYFSDYGIYNLGYSGDRTENVLWRLEQGEVDGINPELAVLLIGTNNTGHRQDDPECTAEGIKRILNSLNEQLPDTKILLLAIFPRGEYPDDELRLLNDEINQKIKTFEDQENVIFADLSEIFLKDDDNLDLDVMPDVLHPNEQGYLLWAEAMLPYIRDLLGR